MTGKVLIIKTFGISQFMYLAGLIPFPGYAVNEINTVLYDYIWNGKTCKVKRNVFIQNYDDGGLRMPDLEAIVKSQKLKWVSLNLRNHDAFWQHTMQALIGIQNLNVFFASNFEAKHFCNHSPFYKEVLQALNDVRFIDNESHEGISRQFIYYNSNVKVNNKYVYCKEILNIEIWKVKDLFDENGKVIKFRIWQS